jgi:hypothetical protein
MFDAQSQPAFTPEMFGNLNEQILDASRAAAEMFLDMYEQSLESIASYHEFVASQTDVPWIGTAAEAQAKFTRELAKRQVSVGRDLIT